ncbi:thiaminase II [Bifidobacterium myosotis]|uniref:Aminopyrimidine aminohydrolase n=1 Tax=Bifidobacterium myosotis TaxID=1630166 RepID=A0A261FDM7_9BIFI|nr:thiaminase II [Bifidobacterium myosotis]KAA8828001.1 thiaminase II [Bifidobacterium myosotis]OZG57135.1 thiaminase II [Bifidobacterium myosotis]
MTADTVTSSSFDAAAFGPITLDHLPPFAQRLRKAADHVWEEGYRQPFLRELGAGTLDREKFAFYLLQDYRYLDDYAKVHALALTKTHDPEIMRFMVDVQNAIFNVESAMHRKYMASFGVTEAEMNSVRQSAFARAYTSNILSIAYGNPLVDVLVAVLPCAWVYADYGQRLAREFGDSLESNPYKSWVDTYKTDEFWSSAAWLLKHIETLVEGLSEERKAELTEIFVVGVENEYMFWASAYDMQYSWKPEWDRARA